MASFFSYKCLIIIDISIRSRDFHYCWTTVRHYDTFMQDPKIVHHRKNNCLIYFFSFNTIFFTLKHSIQNLYSICKFATYRCKTCSLEFIHTIEIFFPEIMVINTERFQKLVLSDN